MATKRAVEFDTDAHGSVGGTSSGIADDEHGSAVRPGYPIRKERKRGWAEAKALPRLVLLRGVEPPAYGLRRPNCHP